MFTFNGRRADDPDLGIFRVLRVFFPLLPGTTDRLLSVPGMDGAHDFGRDLQPCTIKVQFVMKHGTPEELFSHAREVAAWLNVGEVKRFIYDYEPDKYYMARPQGIIDFDRLMNKIGIIEVNFIAPDPFAYAMETKVADVFPAVNAGTAPCPALITATMPAAADFLRVEVAGISGYFLIDRELDQGDIVTIDTARRLALINGVDARVYVTAASTYPTLPPGKFSFITEPAGVPLTVEYCERWI
ncbi:distal tail protein Dit [Candidatus Darwinibacter acetoxidans]